VIRYLPVKKPWSNPMYFYALPTHQQAKRVAWDYLKSLVPKEWLKSAPSESELLIRTIFGSTLHLVGMDKPQRIEGNQWDGGVVDESCDQKPGHFDRSIRPALSHRNGWCWRIGVPKRWGPGAAEFKSIWEEWGSGKFGDNYESYTWPSGDILLPDEIEDVKRTLDQKDFEEQYGAIWQGTSGLVFYAFDEKLNVSDNVKYDPGRPLLVGSDFNVDPMAWVVGQYYDPGPINKSGPEFHFFDEIFLRNTNTQKTLNHLHHKYQGHQMGWRFLGDATARARNTRASSSDYAQILNDLRFLNSKVMYPQSNPARADRFAASNAILCNAAGQRRCYLHPKCVNLIQDLSSRAYEPGSREPDDHDDIGHITDAFGYVIHYLKPIAAAPYTSVPQIYVDVA